MHSTLPCSASLPKMYNHIRKRFPCHLRFCSFLGFVILIVLCLRFHPVSSRKWKLFSDEEDEEIYSNTLNCGKRMEDVDYQQNQNEVHAADFVIERLDNSWGRELVENARSKLSDQRKQSSCWQDAYRQLFSSCRQIMKDHALRSRLAWLMSDCFLRESGGRPLPFCPTSVHTEDCCRKLDNFTREVYLNFLIKSNEMCHHLQSHTFKRNTARLVSELNVSSSWAVIKLGEIENQSESLIQNSKAAAEKITNVISKSNAIFERSGEIMEEQSKLREEQTLMATTMLSQLGNIQAKADNIDDKVAASLDQQKQLLDGQNLALQAVGGIHAKADIIGNAVDNIDSTVASSLDLQKQLLDGQSHALQTLGGVQTKVDNIGNAVASSLGQQKQLLDGQNLALEVLGRLQTKAENTGHAMIASLEQQKQLLDGENDALQALNTFRQAQAKAFEESRLALQKLSKDVRHNQHQIISSKQELLKAHNRLAQRSNALLLAQEAFESKQNTILLALDKLFSLYNSVLLESRSMKAFIFYMATVSLIYVLTSTKQTSHIRASLYFGLCISFGTECFLFHFIGNDMSKQAWVTSNTFYVRTTYIVLALIYIIFTVIQYRDYELLSYKLLVELDERMKSIESNIAGNSSLHYKHANFLSTNQKYERQLISRSIAQEPLNPHGRRPNQGELCNSFTASWLDANLADMDSSDDPDYVPSDSD